MRRIRGILALALAVCLGAALPALADYIDRSLWGGMNERDRLMYTAGVVDAIWSILRMNHLGGPSAAIEIASRAEACSVSRRLMDVERMVEQELRAHPQVVPADATLLVLAECTGAPPSGR